MEKPQTQATSKPSSTFYKMRRAKYVSTLRDHFWEVEGSDISQQTVLEVLQLDQTQKVQATNAMKEAFPNSLVVRKTDKEERVTVYKNVAKKNSFTLSVEEPSLSMDETSDIANIKQLIASVSTKLESINQRLNHQLTAENIQRDVVRALVDMQCKLQQRIQELSGTLDKLYESEVTRLLQNQSQCEALCANDKA